MSNGKFCLWLMTSRTCATNRKKTNLFFYLHQALSENIQFSTVINAPLKTSKNISKKYYISLIQKMAMFKL